MRNIAVRLNLLDLLEKKSRGLSLPHGLLILNVDKSSLTMS